MNTRKLNNLNMAMAAAVVLALAAACSMEGAPDGKAGRGLTAVRFTADSAALVQGKTANAARMAGAAWEANDAIGIYMIGASGGLASGNIKEGADNRQYTAATSAGTSGFSAVGSDTIYYPASGNVEFIAYYPYTPSLTDFTLPVSVAADQSETLAIDVLYAPKTGGAYNTDTTGEVGLQFAHKLVKLVFEIGKEDASVAAALDGLEVTITGQATAGTMDLADGTVGTTNSGQTITAKTAGDGTSAEAIVFPAGDNAAVRFKFKNTEGEIFTGAVPSAWIGGKKYAYTVTLKKHEALIKAAITDWGSGDSNPLEVD